MLAAAAAGAVVSAYLTLSVVPTAGQAARVARVGGKPNLGGIWQANNEAHWDLQAHEARAGAVMQRGLYPYDYAQVPAAVSLPFGAAGGVPGSIGVVQGDGQIPYKPEALAIRNDNAKNWIDRDPELKCYLPGTPRAMYMPYPFQITHSDTKVQIQYEFANAIRTIHLDKVDMPPVASRMGHSVARWEGDTLVVDVNDFDGKNWFDRAGNYHSEALKLVERFTLQTPDIIQYEVTIEDPTVYTAPWRIAMPLYRRVEPNMQLMEYRCTEFVEEFLYGNVRKDQLVKTWEGETIKVDITRKIPPEEKYYDWFRR
jgi:hypothetical protein